MCLDVALERVHGDDRACEIGEGVATSGDVLLNTLDSGGVQTDERDGEASPQLTLELLQHMRGGDDEDALAAAAPDEFREQDADLEGLPKADHVRDQDAWLRVLHGKRQLGGAGLMVLVIHEEAVGQSESVLGLRQSRLTDDRLEIEPRAAVVGRIVGDQGGQARVEDLDTVQALVEDRVDTANERRDTGDLDHPPVVGRTGDLLHQPLLMADLDLGPRRVGGGAIRSVPCLSVSGALQGTSAVTVPRKAGHALTPSFQVFTSGHDSALVLTGAVHGMS